MNDRESYKHAINVIKAPFPEGEAAIATSASTIVGKGFNHQSNSENKMSDLEKKDQWKIMTDQDDASLMRMSLNGQEFDVHSFKRGKHRTDGKTMIKIKVLIDLDQLKTGKRIKDYDVQAGQAALDLFHAENDELKKAIASATISQDPELLSALCENRDQAIIKAIAAIAKATGEQS